MAIVSRNRKTNEITNTSYAGRVLKVERVNETRNTSDTLDYSDYRTVESTYALVWLGTHGVPAWNDPHGRSHASLREDREGNTWNPARDLELHEQFAWVDCTTLCPWRDMDDHVAEVDAMVGTCDPMMLVNYIAWQSYQRAAADEAAAQQKAAAAKKADAAAKKAAKSAAAEADARKMLAGAPAKGAKVTVDGFTGKVFWTGVSKYYGKWNARVGVKDARGEVRWIDAAHWAKLADPIQGVV